MQQLEKPLDDAFKKLPQMPENVRKGLAGAMPWLTLLAGVFSLLSAWNVYRIASIANDYLNSMYGAFGYTSAVTGITTTMWLGVAILFAEGVLFLIAFPALRNYKKSGWNLLFWAALVSVLYGVMMNLFNGYFDLGQLIVSLLGAAIGLYLLFQIKSYYTTAGGTTPKPVVAAPEVKTEKPATAKPAEQPTDETDKQA